MNQNNFTRSDLAAECHERALGGLGQISGIDFSEESLGKLRISKLFVLDKEGESTIGKPRGGYITISFGNILSMDDEEKTDLTSCVTRALRELIESCLETPPKKVLIAGLGNRNLTCDALGPLCADLITVTREVALFDRELFEKLYHLETSSIAPGVSGQTGIESTDLIKGAVGLTTPDLVILIDALAASSPERLTRTVQLCDTGISPGAGVGNKRAPLNLETLGVPAIAIGIPTVVDSSTLVFDVLERSGIKENDIPSELLSILENGKNFFVSPKDCDVCVKELSSLVADAVNEALSISS